MHSVSHGIRMVKNSSSQYYTTMHNWIAARTLASWWLNKCSPVQVCTRKQYGYAAPRRFAQVSSAVPLTSASVRRSAVLYRWPVQVCAGQQCSTAGQCRRAQVSSAVPLTSAGVCRSAVLYWWPVQVCAGQQCCTGCQCKCEQVSSAAPLASASVRRSAVLYRWPVQVYAGQQCSTTGRCKCAQVSSAVPLASARVRRSAVQYHGTAPAVSLHLADPHARNNERAAAVTRKVLVFSSSFLLKFELKGLEDFGWQSDGRQRRCMTMYSQSKGVFYAP